MATNASTELITALKASLADASKGWAVQRVSESRSVASLSVSGGGGSISSGYGEIAEATGSSTERVRSKVELVAGAIIHGAEPMRLVYSEVKVAGSFSEAFVDIGGGELRSTDTDLNTTIMGMAAAFLAAHDAAMIAALGASDPLDLPDVIADGMVATLADAAAQWRCTSSMPMAIRGGGVMRSVSLFSAVLRIGGAPTNIQYMEETAIDGTLITAQVMSGGRNWRTRHAGLRAAIQALGNAFAAARAADMEGALG